MAAKRQMTQRELWLVSILPGALILIVAQAYLGMKGPATQIEALETQVASLTSTQSLARQSEKMQKARELLRSSEEELELLLVREEGAREHLAVLQNTSLASLSLVAMTQAMDALAQRLPQYGVAVVSVAPRNGDGAITSAPTPAVTAPTPPPQDPSGVLNYATVQAGVPPTAAETSTPVALPPAPPPTEWSIRVVATWPNLRAALADGAATPFGLALKGLTMEESTAVGNLRHWELVVKPTGGLP